MLRRSLQLEIQAALKSPPFIYPEDFNIKESNKDKESATHLQINYLCDEGQYFVAVIPHKKTKGGEYGDQDFAIAGRFNPGEITDDQTESLRGQRELLSEIKSWVSRIGEDLKSIPEFRAMEEMDARMADIESRLGDIPDTYATPEQIAQLQDLLNNLEKELAAQINALELSVDEKNSRIDELQRQFEALRQKSQGGKVRQMLRTIVSRVYRTACDPDIPKLIENGKKIVGLLAGPATGSDPPTDA